MAHFVADVVHKDKNGNVIWRENNVRNIFHDGGEEYIIKACFTEEVSVPANHYLRLDNRSSLAEADVLSSLSAEPTTNGYAAVAITTNTTGYTASQDSGDWQAATKTCTFSASGGSVGPVANMNLCDASTGTSGRLLCSLALSQSRTLSDGESLDATMTLKVSE